MKFVSNTVTGLVRILYYTECFTWHCYWLF